METAKPDKVFYGEDGEVVRLDLRPYGIDCLRLFARCNLHSVREGAELHYHPGCTEICLCLNGNLRFETEDQEYPFTPGRVFVSNQDQPHRLIGKPKGLKTYSFLFEVPKPNERILGLSVRESNWLSGKLTHFPMRLFPASERVKLAFNRVWEEYCRRDDDRVRYCLELRSAVLEMLLALVEAPGLPSQRPASVDPKMAAVIKRLKSEPYYDYPIERLAAETGLSTTAFTESFKAATGLPPHAFLLSQRLEQAREELRRGKMPVARLAKRYGFSSSRHFSTAFRKMFGICPRDFQKQK